MHTAIVIIVLPLFLTMTSTNGQPSDCACYNGGVDPPCYARGCSRGNNPSCYNGHYVDSGGDRGFTFANLNFWGTNGYTGCNCPGYSYISNNGFYHDISSRSGYNYDTCTSYGLNARDHSSDVPGGANDAIDCCNYCCDRHDPYDPIITTTSKTIPTTSVTNTVSVTTRTTTQRPTTTTTTPGQPDGCDCFTGGYSYDYGSGGSRCSGSSSCSSCRGCSGGSCCAGVSSCCITDCCNYCCNRPVPVTTTEPITTVMSTTIGTTTGTATSGDHGVIIIKPLYLSALIMLALVILKTN